MQRLHEGVGGDGVVILADADGVVIERHGDGGFADRAERVALTPGVVWSEGATGTNAIGTALAERRDVTVFGAEHFFESHRVLTCTAAPIFGPDGETLGVLDLSGRAEGRASGVADDVRAAVAAIERTLFLEATAGSRVLGIRRDGGRMDGEGLLAFRDDRLVAVDRVALALLERDREALTGRRWGDLFEGRCPSLDSVDRLVTRDGRACLGRLHASGTTSSVGWRAERATVPVPVAAPVSRPPQNAPAVISDETRDRALARATRLIDADVPVLVQGETGTGKEVFARALHAGSRRAGRPFVAVNCAALPEGLIEAELFGYEEGAFTGARRKGAKGLMREADGGTLFLDEIGDMALPLQARLLRALQEREVTPLGGTRPVPVDFALICATHKGLLDAVEARTFRQDLYFRIAQYTVELPPLRGRPDLASAIDRLWAEQARATEGATLSPALRDHLAAHHWPGNFRQLTTVLRTLAILADPGEVLTIDALPADLRVGRRTTSATPAPAGDGAIRVSAAAPAAVAERSDERLDAVALATMRAVLADCGGNVTRAAARLGIHRSTLYRRLFDGR
jgi:transcriptional regulator of acetoin/glycerol metabolism